MFSYSKPVSDSQSVTVRGIEFATMGNILIKIISKMEIAILYSVTLRVIW
jgi:hypothetical protein